MDKNENRRLLFLKKDTVFLSICKKIALTQELNESEKEYILKIVIVLYKFFLRENNRYYFEFAYYLLLNYSIKSGDYYPLNDFCCSVGFYPISRLIYEKQLINKNIFDVLYNSGIDRFKNEKRIETNEQFHRLKDLLSSGSNNRSLIAPTSYGKSEFILDDIAKHHLSKVGIIVPTKALIWETFRRVKVLAKNNNYRVLIHDTEYTDNKKFIAVFTQERALRLLAENGVFFDILYIDEAHNLFEKSDRNILLSRLIKLNQKLNNNQKIVYLSPLICDSKNLLFDQNAKISEQKISFNLKEPKIFYFKKDGEEEAYNRFINLTFSSGKIGYSWKEYIFKKTMKKSLLYSQSPKSVQNIALELSLILPSIESPEINEIIEIMEKYFDKDFYMVKLLKKGVIYVHRMVPDSIRDYLLNKFKTSADVKYLVSNKSVLEGVNFPIDSMFILNARSLQKNALLNLIGRVNRLNEIFSNEKDISKLMPPIYFVETGCFESGTNLYNKMTMLRSVDAIDEVENPTLPSSKNNDEGLLKKENAYIESFDSLNLRNVLIKSGIDSYYLNFERALEKIKNNIDLFLEKRNNSSTGLEEIFSIVFSIFFNGFEYDDFKDKEVARLINKKAISFYANYFEKAFFKDVKTKILFFMNHFQCLEKKDDWLYIGDNFGEISKETPIYSKPSRKMYVDLKTKNHEQKINIAITKAAMEDEVLSIIFTSFVKSLFDYKIIEIDIYNKFLYNTDSEPKIKLLKSGLSHQVIHFLEENDLMDEVIFNDIGFQPTDKLVKIISEQDDYVKFELNKIIGS